MEGSLNRLGHIEAILDLIGHNLKDLLILGSVNTFYFWVEFRLTILTQLIKGEM